jgi:hypothetical protein
MAKTPLMFATDHDLKRSDDLRFKQNQSVQGRKMANAIGHPDKALSRFEAMRATFGAYNTQLVYPFAKRAAELNQGTLYSNAFSKGLEDGKISSSLPLSKPYGENTVANWLYEVAFKVGKDGNAYAIMNY